jgi:GAF domain-containing protein/DNA-binding response OmpR family regulator
MRQPQDFMPQTERVRRQTARRIIVIVMLVSLIIGGIIAVSARNYSREQLEDAQRSAVSDVSAEYAEWWNSAQEDTRFLATSSLTRNFAALTLQASAANVGAALTDAQSELLQIMTTTMERNRGSYLAVRYVTANGFVWSEVTNYENTIAVTINSTVAPEYQADPTIFEAGLNTPINEVAVSPMRFRRFADIDQLIEPLTPFFRFVSPVDPAGDLMTVSGMIQIDVAAQPILNLATQAANDPAVVATNVGRRLILADENSTLLVDSGLPRSNILQRLANGIGVPIASQLEDIGEVVAANPDGLSAVTVGTRLVSLTPLPINIGGQTWKLIVIDNLNAALDSANLNAIVVVAAAVMGGSLLSLILNGILKRAMQPLESASAVALQIANAGDAPLDTTAAAPADGMSEILQAFETLRAQVRNLNQTLDISTQRYQRNLEIAARISRETATLRDVDELLNRTIQLISTEYGFYHAQIFLVDDIGKNALLRYSMGEAGAQLLAMGHKLAVGSASVIGQVTARGTAVIVTDTTTNESGEPHRFNPLLPTTRAEMALPMMIGGRIIGALDIQSESPDVFREDEIQIFQLLADQIAIAIQNARLIVESETRVQQIADINRQFTQRAWQGSLESGEVASEYTYDLIDMQPVAPDHAAYSVPITVRGVVIGELAANADPDMALTDGDQVFLRAIADRVGLAIEGARLLTETQTSLVETFVLYQLSRSLSDANSLRDLIEAIITSVMPDALGGQIMTFNDADDDEQKLTIVAEWYTDDNFGLTDLELTLSEHPLLASLTAEQVTLVEDVDADSRLGDILRGILRDALGAQSAVFIPFSVRGIWRGVLCVVFSEARVFSEQDGRLYTALIDQAGVAIDNRLLLTQNEVALAQIERLYGGSRIVNMAQSAQDVVRAAVASNNDTSLGFELALLEGELDETGYPTQMRVVSRTRGMDITTIDEVHPLNVSPDSLLRQRQPTNISTSGVRDAGARDFRPYMRQNRYQFGMIFPLYSANQPIAYFFVVSEEAHQMTSEDQEVYRALTGQMSVVLQNRRLLEQTAQALDETRRLYDASSQIAAAQDADSVFTTAADHLAMADAPITRVSLLLAEGTNYDAPSVIYDNVWTRSEAYRSSVRKGVRVSADLVSFGRMFNADGPLLRFNDVDAELPAMGQEALHGLLNRSKSKSAMLIALQTRNKWLGLLMLESDQKGAFPTQFMPFAQAVSDQLAIAVDSLQSFAEAQNEARRALALAEAGQLANQIGADLAASLGEVFSRVANAANYRNWQLLIADERGEWLEEVTAYLPRASQTRATHYNITKDRHSLLDAYKSGKPLLINDPVEYEAFAGYAEDTRVEFGKHIVVPILQSGRARGALLLGRYLNEADLTERDEQLALTLASQVAVALENRRLLRSAETERETLRRILSTLPVGVIVLDARTLLPLQTNEQIEALLGRALATDVPFSIESYNIYRTGTNVHYPQPELPIYKAIESRQQEVADDVSVIQPDGFQVDMLVNAAPLLDEMGEPSAVIVAFQDISTLRTLENTLQDNLRETITLYETTRALAETPEVEDVLDLIIGQLAMQDPDEVYVLLDDSAEGLRVARSLSGTAEVFPLPYSALDPQQPRLVENTADSARVTDDTERAAAAAAGISAFMALPLRARFRTDAPLGYVVMIFSQPQVFTMEREQSVNTLIESASVTLDNRYLFRSTDRALEETAALYRATTAVSRAQDSEELSNALQDALIWLQPDVYAAYLDQEGALNLLFNISALGTAPDFAPALRHYPMTVNSEALFIPDVAAADTSDALAAELATLGNLRSIGIVPLRLQGRSAGVLIVGYAQPHNFSESEARYLSSVADSASVIADNIELLAQVQNTLTETSMLYLASRDLNDVSTPEDLLNVVLEHLLDRSVSHVLVMLLNEKAWNNPAAVLNVAASWRPDEVMFVDMANKSFTAKDFPAWSLFSAREILVIDDVEHDERLDAATRDCLLGYNMRSVSLMPLVASALPLGVIVIGSDVTHTHTIRDERVYRSVSRQASLRLEATRLLAQTERRARQLATSARVSQLASSLEELSRLLPTVVDLIKDAFGYDHVQIFLMDEEDRYAVLRASTGEAGQKLLARNHKLEKGSQSVIGQVTANGQPTLAMDTADAKVTHRPNPLLPNTRAEVAVPLIVKSRIVGALDVQSNQANFFTDEDIDVLAGLAAQISVAIDNSQLYEQTEARAKDMYFLFTVATAASGADNLQEAMQNVVVTLQELLDAASVTIYLPYKRTDGDKLSTELRPAALAGADMPLSELSEVRLSDTRLRLAESAVEQRPLLISDVQKERGYVPVIESARSAMIVPLTVGASLVSVITVESNYQSAYNDDTLTLLLTLSGTLAATVQNQQLVEELQATNEQLLELDRLKSDFLANMSHELRTPLNSIIGFSRVILKGIDGPLSEMQEQDLTTIYNSGQHLLNLINDILDQAKIAAGKMDLQTDYFEMKPVIDGVRSIGIGLVKDKPIEILINVANGMAKAFGDEFRTRQVLLNLVSNAAKFTREGTITINAFPSKEAESGRDMICVEVVDTGIGIAEKDLPLLFEEFRQVDSSLTKTHAGTGLGLPIAKSLIEMQGGRMTVRSQVNVGSTFTIYVPTQPLTNISATAEMPALPETSAGDTGRLDPNKLPAHILEQLANISKEPGGSNSNGGNGNGHAEPPVTNDTVKQHIPPAAPRKQMHIKRQILLIEDNPDMVDQFRRALQREGFDVFAASIPLEAEAMASGLRPTLIVLDANFANDAGWGILERLSGRVDTLDIPIIVVALGSDAERAEKLGAFRFIRKPFMPEKLADAAKEAEKEAQVSRILIIDDQPESARLLGNLLDESGKYRVIHASSGMEGVSLVAQRRPDLVIVDLRMPEMDGFAVIRELRANPEISDMPIMVVTGDTLNAEEFEELSHLRVVYKPDLNMGGARTFLDIVSDHLADQQGER